MEIAQRVPFRPNQCPQCQSYVENGQRCRAFTVESWPKPLLAVLAGESNEPCPRFSKIAATQPGIAVNVPPTPQPPAVTSSVTIIPADATPTKGSSSEIKPPTSFPKESSTIRMLLHSDLESKLSQADDVKRPIQEQEPVKICPRCKTQLSMRERACPTCGARFSVVFKGYCPTCETVVQVSGSNRCSRCGGEVSDARYESRFLEIAPSPTVPPATISQTVKPGPVRATVMPASESPKVTPAPISPTPTQTPISPSVTHAPIKPTSQAGLYCPKCKSANPGNLKRCQICGANLLPAEGVFTRLGFGLGGILGGALAGGVAYLKVQYEELFSVCPSPLYFGGAAIFIPIFGLAMALRRTPPYVRYENRAKRHLEISPLQAVADFSQAILLAPEKEVAGLLKQRAALYEKIGRQKDALRDTLALTSSPGSLANEALLVKMIGGDTDTYLASRKESLQADLIKSGKAKAIGYCRKCKQVVELNAELRCLEHQRKADRVRLVLPEETEAGKQAILIEMQKEHRENTRRNIVNLIALVAAAFAIYYAFITITGK
jgi:hypothetical protein